MIKTIILKVEGTLLNDEFVRFKIYERLWYYIRRDPQWHNFSELLKMREFYLTDEPASFPYLNIARRHLSERDLGRFNKELQLFHQKLRPVYLRQVPGMPAVMQSLNYYYQIILIAEDTVVSRKAIQKFRWRQQLYFLKPFHGSIVYENYHQAIQEVLSKTHSQPDATVMIAEKVYPELDAARNLGILTIQTRFSPKTKGFMAQSFREREYLKSIENVPDSTKFMLRRGMRVNAIVSTPHELLKTVEDFEENRPSTRAPREEVEVQQVSIWSLLKELMNTLSNPQKQ